MTNDILFLFQTMTLEQIKAEIDKNEFVDKNLKDYIKGKEVVDNLIELNNADNNVKTAILLYCMYRIKGGK